MIDSKIVNSISNGMIVATFIIVTLAFIGCIAFVLYRCIDMRRNLHRKYTYLEVTPPASAAVRPQATQELFTVIHSLRETRSFSDVLLRRKVVLSFEITAARRTGIRYVVRVPQHEAMMIEREIVAYLPEVTIKRIDDYLWGVGSRRLLEFKQAKHFALPLNAKQALDTHDPVAYLTNAMTKLTDSEQIALQFVVTPIVSNAARRISRKILTNEDLLHHITERRLRFPNVFTGVNSLLFEALDGVGDLVTAPTKHSTVKRPVQDPAAQQKQQAALRLRPARTLSSFEQEIVESIHQKVDQPLFRTDIRAMVIADSAHESLQRAKGLRGALTLFSVPQYQAITAKRLLPLWPLMHYRQFKFNHRLPSLFHSSANILSTGELADLYHFPYAGTTKTENIVKSLSRKLPAPLSLKNGTAFDVAIGNNIYHGSTTLIGLTEKERERHVYIIGGTGNGKTTMLQYMIVQDMQNGKGVAVVDPHGDMAETLLTYVPEGRIKDVIYFNPDDLSYPVGLNLLELKPGLSDDDLLREKDLITEAVVSIFRKIFSDDDSGGHRIEYLLRNAVQTALTQKDATLFTVYDLINSPSYRNKVVATLDDVNLKNFWRNEFGKAGGMQQVKMAAGITSKIGRFLFSASAKRVLEQPASTIDFDDIITSGKILICNFSKGLIGEDTSELFGIMVLAKLQLASLRQARVKQADRKPFYLYVDEFQNFATPSFVQMLSESRKYKLHLIMAEQSTSQQDDKNMVNIILANVGTVVCFRTGNPADEQQLLPLFAPEIEAGEISHLPAFNYYVRIAAIHSQEPLSGETIILDDSSHMGVSSLIIQNSRKLYTLPYHLRKGQKDTSSVKSDTLIRKSKPQTFNEHPLKLPSK